MLLPKMEAIYILPKCLQPPTRLHTVIKDEHIILHLELSNLLKY
jgi:hypothetical protein